MQYGRDDILDQEDIIGCRLESYLRHIRSESIYEESADVGNQKQRHSHNSLLQIC